MAQHELDLAGLKCPLPALKTAKALKSLANGDILIVTCTDPMAEIDIPNLLRETGNSLESKNRHHGTLIFRILKA